MKNFIVIIFCLTCLPGISQTQLKTANKPIKGSFECSNGLMTPAWYECGFDRSISAIKAPDNSFVILVDTNCKATNFISASEDYYRRQSNKLDTAYLKYAMPGNWQYLPEKEKMAVMSGKMDDFKRKADLAHKENNKGKIPVWIINNSKDTVSIQMQDWGYICVLQGLSKEGEWLPIQYWQFSKCANSYYSKHFLPQTANSFTAAIPNSGDYETMLRFKLLGTDRFYYSNEFTGKINYCEFVEDFSKYYARDMEPRPQYKLDSLMYLSLDLRRKRANK